MFTHKSVQLRIKLSTASALKPLYTQYINWELRSSEKRIRKSPISCVGRSALVGGWTPLPRSDRPVCLGNRISGVRVQTPPHLLALHRRPIPPAIQLLWLRLLHLGSLSGRGVRSAEPRPPGGRTVSPPRLLATSCTSLTVDQSDPRMTYWTKRLQ